MNDVLILALNSKYIHSSLAPWYLKSAVASLDIECRVLEHTVNESIDEIANEIVALSPKVLAVSVYIWNITFTYKLLKMVKVQLPDVAIVLGGPEVSYNIGDVFDNCKEVDYVISGEGERPFFELCRHLFFGGVLECSGVSYRSGNKNFLSQPYIGVGTPKSPYTQEYLCALNGRISYFESSRGCPYSCAYCLSGRCEGMRFFDMQYVKENLVLLANSGTKTVKFVDRTFNADRLRANEIWEFIISGRGSLFPDDVCFHFELSGDLLDEEAFEVLSRAPNGLFQFEIGIQSFYDKTIESIHRVTKSEELKRKISRLISLGNAHIHTDLIAGLPFEGYEDFKNSFNSAYSLSADMLQLGFLKILHGTELEEKAAEYALKYSKTPPYEVFSTPWLSKSDLEKLKTVEYAVDKLHNSGRFKRTLAFCIPIFESPFDFFYKFGEVVSNSKGLDELTDSLYNFICNVAPEKEAELRDIMILDRLATNSSKQIPSSLYRADARLAACRNSLTHSKESGFRRSVAILYHYKKFVYVDYTDKNFRGEYKLNFVDFDCYEKT